MAFAESPEWISASCFLCKYCSRSKVQWSIFWKRRLHVESVFSSCYRNQV